MSAPSTTKRLVVAAAVMGLLIAASVSRGQLPRIDPTGRRVFTWDGAPYKLEPSKPTHSNTGYVQTLPARIVSPVGAEVVVLAMVCGRDGYMRANERIEWMLAPDDAGMFVQQNPRHIFDCFLGGATTAPTKFDNDWAVGLTSSKFVQLTRGTPTFDDDLPVKRGQAWITVTSPVEGISHVTAFAPSVYEWGQRKQTSTIYWVDAAWALPPSAVNQVGMPHTFTTSVTRQTDGSPLVGWLVRYEINNGPEAAFLPGNLQVVEVPTDGLGQASVEMAQLAPAAGVNTIGVQVIRPAGWNGKPGERLVVGSGTTTKTWSAPSLTIRSTGPSEASIGSSIRFRVEVRNTGSLSTRNVVVTQAVPQGATYLSSVPDGRLAGDRLEWQLGDLGAGETRTIDVNLRVDRTGAIQNCANVTTAEGLTAQDCVTTTVVTPTLELTLSAPDTAAVGQPIDFRGVIVNRGTVPATGLRLLDRFDAGLEHDRYTSPIERDIETIQPGQSVPVTLTLRATRPGRFCNTMEVVGDSGVKAFDERCVNVVEAGAAVPPPPTTGGATPGLSITVNGPTTAVVDQTVLFSIEVRNNTTTEIRDLHIVNRFDAALEIVQAAQGGAYEGSDFAWSLDRLPPGRAQRFDVQYRTIAPTAAASVRGTVSAQGLAPQTSAPAYVRISPPGGAGAPPTATGGLVLSANAADNPVAVGSQSAYVVRITNNTGAVLRNVAVTIETPGQYRPQVVGTQAPSQARVLGGSARFDPVPTMQPGQSLDYRLAIRAERPGQATAVVTVAADGLPQPSTAEIRTDVFAP